MCSETFCEVPAYLKLPKNVAKTLLMVLFDGATADVIYIEYFLLH